MPTLQLRADGCFYIRHFYRDHSTWQVLGEGVRYLERRGFIEGQRFSTDVFMDLYMRGLVYHGEVPTQARPQAEPRDTHQAAALRSVVREFHQFVHAGAADQAWAAVYQRTQDPEMRSMFCSEVQGLAGNKLSSWTIKDLIIYDMQGESASFPNAKRIGMVILDIRFVAGTPSVSREKELTEYWLEFDDGWRFAWTGFY